MSEGFTSTRLQEERDKDKRETFTISINKQDRLNLDADKRALEQSKDSTAIKQMWEIGRYVLHHDKIGKIYQMIDSNRNRNKKSGIVDFE